MNVYKSLVIAISLLFFQSSALAKSGEHYEFSQFKDISSLVEEKIEQFGAGEVLIALDIDNTTLATENDLGSEHWFLWQAKLLGEGRIAEAIADTVPELLFLQSQVLALSKMRPVEEKIPLELKRWGKLGVKMLALTSRGAENHDATLRELKRNGFPYQSFSPSGSNKISEVFLPYDTANPQKQRRKLSA